MDHRFPEPRGWAGRWEGTALSPSVDCVSWRGAIREAAAAGWATPSRASDGSGGDGLVRPLGWALEWDGAALAERARPDASAPLRAAKYEREDIA